MALNNIPCSMVNTGIQPDHYLSTFNKFENIYSSSELYNQLNLLAEQVLNLTFPGRFIFFLGCPGCGKSMFLVCLFRALVYKSGGIMGANSASYFQFGKMINEIIEDLSYSSSTRKSLNKLILPIRYLFIDDFSTHVQVQDPNKIESVVLREILMDRYEQQKLLFATSNYSKSQFKQMLKTVYGEYMVSRIFSSSLFVEFPKIDMRKKLVI